MFGLDEGIAEFSNGASIWIVLAVAVLLGIRHATDPDHLAAVTTLVGFASMQRSSQANGRARLATPASSGLPGASATRRRCSPWGFPFSSSMPFFRSGFSRRRRPRSGS